MSGVGVRVQALKAVSKRTVGQADARKRGESEGKGGKRDTRKRAGSMLQRRQVRQCKEEVRNLRIRRGTQTILECVTTKWLGKSEGISFQARALHDATESSE